MATLAEVQVKINADLAPLRSAFAQAKKMSADLDRALSRSQRTIGATFKADSSIRDRRRDIEAYGKSLDDLRAKYNPLFAMQRRYKSELADIKRALAVGAINQNEYNAAIARTKSAFAAQVQGMNLTRNAMMQSTQAVQLNNQQLMNMNYQITDLAVMTASGQNPFIMIMQQGMQMADILTVAAGQTLTLRGAMAAVGQSITRFFSNPLNLAVIGTAAVAGSIPLIWNAINGSDGQEALDSMERFNNLLDEIGESAPEVADRVRDIFDAANAPSYTQALAAFTQEIRSSNEEIALGITQIDNYAKARQQMAEDAATSGVTLANLDNETMQRIDSIVTAYQNGSTSTQDFLDSLAELSLDDSIPSFASDAIASLQEFGEGIKEAEARLEALGFERPSQAMIDFTQSMMRLSIEIDQFNSSTLREKFEEIQERIQDSDHSLDDVIRTLDELESSSLNLDGQIQEFVDLARAAATAAGEIERVGMFTGMTQDPAANERISGTFRSFAEEDARKRLAELLTPSRESVNRAKRRAEEMAANQQFLADLEREVQILSMSYNQREQALVQFEREKSIREAIADLGETATPQQAERLRQLLELQYALNDSIEDEQEARVRTNELLKQSGSIIGGALKGLINDTKSLKEAALEAALAFAEMALQAQISSAIRQSPGAGNFLSGFVSSMLGGYRAAGGPVSSRTPYYVGERGKELFIPNTSGKIVPNQQINKPQVAQPQVKSGDTYNIDARGAAPEAVARLETMVMRLQRDVNAMPQRIAGMSRDNRVRV